jgi:hypothetical protein
MAVVAFCAATFVQAQEVPKHLQLAREFLANVKPENNAYLNNKVYTRHPTDLFSKDYVIATDCGGFVEDMFLRTKSGVVEQVKTQKFKDRKSIYDWHPSIERSEAFERLTKVTDLLPGDAVAWLYVDGHSTGHILFVDSVPVKIKSRKPIVEQLDQYEIKIIDVSQAAKSLDDTRYVDDPAERSEYLARGKERGTAASANRKGIGSATIRMYADSQGVMKGMALNLPNVKFHPDVTDWNIVMGRPKIKN